MPPLDQAQDIPFRHAPSWAEVGSGWRRISSRGKMPLATDRDPSGVKQKNLSFTAGPPIGNLILARSKAETGGRV